MGHAAGAARRWAKTTAKVGGATALDQPAPSRLNETTSLEGSGALVASDQ
ncbi:MAG: hypothetical protein R3F11_23010 [Verrucomicrobiales bacterium]